MNQRQQRNTLAAERIRASTIRYVAQLRGEGLSDEDIQTRIVEDNTAIARQMEALSPDDEVSAELHAAFVALATDALSQQPGTVLRHTQNGTLNIYWCGEEEAALCDTHVEQRRASGQTCEYLDVAAAFDQCEDCEPAQQEDHSL